MGVQTSAHQLVSLIKKDQHLLLSKVSVTKNLLERHSCQEINWVHGHAKESEDRRSFLFRFCLQ